MKMAYLTMAAGLCAIASCAWGTVSFHEKDRMDSTRALLPAAVERTNKSDRMVHAFNSDARVLGRNSRLPWCSRHHSRSRRKHIISGLSGGAHDCSRQAGDANTRRHASARADSARKRVVGNAKRIA
jgi:hypothetical protein